MRKPRQHLSGSPANNKNKNSSKSPIKISANHATKQQQASALINRGKLQEAEEIYKDLIAAGVSNHIIYGRLAALCAMQDKVDESIKLIRHALNLEPSFPEAFTDLGIVLKKRGKLRAAIRSYKISLKLQPNSPEAQYNLGNALHIEGRLDAAIRSYRIALQLKPNSPDIHKNLGNALKDLGDINAAINSYNIALQLKPNCPDTCINLSMAELLAGDYKSGWHRYEYRFQSRKIVKFFMPIHLAGYGRGSHLCGGKTAFSERTRSW